MADNDNDIIIKGGSVEVSLDERQYNKEPPSNGRIKFHSDNRKIVHIKVVDDVTKEVIVDKEDQSGLKWTITVTTKG